MGRRQTNATNVTTHPLGQTIWWDTWSGWWIISLSMEEKADTIAQPQFVMKSVWVFCDLLFTILQSKDPVRVKLDCVQDLTNSSFKIMNTGDTKIYSADFFYAVVKSAKKLKFLTPRLLWSKEILSLTVYDPPFQRDIPSASQTQFPFGQFYS